jgi:hypothetical protein
MAFTALMLLRSAECKLAKHCCPLCRSGGMAVIPNADSWLTLGCSAAFSFLIPPPQVRVAVVFSNIAWLLF